MQSPAGKPEVRIYVEADAFIANHRARVLCALCNACRVVYKYTVLLSTVPSYIWSSPQVGLFGSSRWSRAFMLNN